MVMMTDEGLRRALDKTLKFINQKSKRDRRITVEYLVDLSSNDLFYDNPILFGISKLEAQRIRNYFEEDSDYGFVEELHETFPEFFKKERKEYLNMVNIQRREDELKPLSL